MSLISQNPVPKKKMPRTKNDDVTLLLEEEEGEEEVVENPNEMESMAERKQKRKRVRKEDDELIEQEKEMEKKLAGSLFGSLYNQVEFGKIDDGVEDAKEEELDDDVSPLYFTDRTANSMLSVYDENMDNTGQESIEGLDKNQRKPVWVDDEEEKTTINIAKVNKLRKLRKEENETVISGSAYVSRLRAQHIKMYPGTDWARPDSQPRDYSSEDDEDGNADSILRTNEDFVVKRRNKVLPGLLEYSKLVDANVKDPCKGLVNSVQFHNNSQLLLVGGLDRTLKFFQVDGKKNEMIQSVFLEDCPIRKAAFLPDGSQVIVSGRRKFAYTFDLVNARVDKISPLVGRDEKSLECFEISPDSNTIAFIGNEGYILLVSSKTKELIGTLKMNGTARSLAFTHDGQKLLSSGGDGKIYHWDMRTRTCFHIGTDDGCLNGTSLTTSPVGNLFAAGSDSGVVNIYDGGEFLGGKKKPIKAVENLTTRVDFMKFNVDAQILAIGSRMKKDGMRMVHVGSRSVFSNWPPSQKALGHPTCVDFSPRGGFMVIGNAAGKVLLYKLHQYHQA